MFFFLANSLTCIYLFLDFKKLYLVHHAILGLVIQLYSDFKNIEYIFICILLLFLYNPGKHFLDAVFIPSFSIFRKRY